MAITGDSCRCCKSYRDCKDSESLTSKLSFRRDARLELVYYSSGKSYVFVKATTETWFDGIIGRCGCCHDRGKFRKGQMAWTFFPLQRTPAIVLALVQHSRGNDVFWIWVAHRGKNLSGTRRHRPKLGQRNLSWLSWASNMNFSHSKQRWSTFFTKGTSRDPWKTS